MILQFKKSVYSLFGHWHIQFSHLLHGDSLLEVEVNRKHEIDYDQDFYCAGVTG